MKLRERRNIWRIFLLALTFISFFQLAHRSKQVEQPLSQLCEIRQPRSTGDISSSDNAKRLIVHVTKEYGLSVFGGLGRAVTDLAEATARVAASQSQLEVSVISPKYTYLDISNQIVTDIAIDVTIDNRVYKCLVHQVQQLASQVVIYYVTALAQHPTLSVAFQASDSFNIYYTDPRLDQEVQDLYFNLVAAQVLRYLGREHIVIAHIHGATNAPSMMFYLQQNSSLESVHFAYSIHDYSFEPIHSLLVSNLERFMDKTQDFVKGSVWRPSYYGIMHAQRIVIASRTLASQIYDKESQLLQNVKWWQRRYTQSMIEALLLRCQDSFAISNGVAPTSDYQELISQPDLLRRSKDWSKRRIISQFRLQKLDGGRQLPLVLLYIGRFSHDKGMQDVHFISNYIRDSQLQDVLLIVMGQPSDYSMKRFVPHKQVLIIDTPEQQSKYGRIIRQAADIVIVPSRHELFGLVGVEALMEGSLIFSTGVGGLQEYLNENENAYLYSIEEQDLIQRLDRLLVDYRSWSLKELQERRKRWMQSAQKLLWTTQDGLPNESLQQYLYLYGSL